MHTLAKPSPLVQVLLGRRALITFALLLTYGGGLWLHLLHEAEGATEPGAPPGILHWLRDSSLSLPLVAVGVLLGGTLARQLLARHGRNASPVVVTGLVAVVVALYASAVLSFGNPIHGYLFASTHGGHDLPLAIHVLRDGLLALIANEVLAASLAGLILGRVWLKGRRVWARATTASPALQAR